MTKNSEKVGLLHFVVNDAAVPTQNKGTSIFYITRSCFILVTNRYIYVLMHKTEVYSSVHVSIKKIQISAVMLSALEL